ncbi:hypothetical protein [Aquimarina sp. 2201CG14-23]|uniref:hypothetical protein n=1 Tax=Aquimarina mycalae TaxID=3040073 RepID=UPI002477F858|nr:hypothetical protein [Aquimarina sp. 2201CG14-23]MDH7447379.1 hypothetical protein [Aquimarina sp. 2201CG14-23]
MKYHLVIVILITFITNAQQNFITKDIISSYEEYIEMPREVAYVHLNKSTYIKGENIGFNAYILNKSDKKFSTETTNLYCVISDKNNTIIKSKLVMVQQGISRGSFAIDSLFGSGEYTFKAYTNWMKNFSEKNFFIQKIRIIDPKEEPQAKPKLISNTIDAQFLPEGGHFITGINNTVGVTIKDSLGFGISSLTGEILDAQSNVISTFKTNQLGIGRFSFIPKVDNTYSARIQFNNQEQTFSINKIESKGVLINLQDLGDKLAIRCRTNTATLFSLQNRYFTLAIHNGSSIKKLTISFNDNIEETKVISHNDLFPGINIFTLFDDQNNPISERQFFNHEGISFIKSQRFTHKKEADSILINLSYDNIDLSLFNNASISVLPSDTKSYRHHHNLPSYTLLQPYIQGHIENAPYYFTKINKKKKYELDNLLLTQGWSSYDWNTIFNNPPEYDYDYEKGIGFTATLNNQNGIKLMHYPTIIHPTELIELDSGDNQFERNELFLLEDEKIRFGEIQSNGDVKKPYVFLKFKPSTIPSLDITNTILSVKDNNLLQSSETSPFQDIEELGEVVLIKKREYTKHELLQNKSFGKIEEFDEKKKRYHRTFANYISTQGFYASDNPAGGADFIVINRNPPTPNNNIPTIYLDGVLLSNVKFLQNYQLNQVDYIEVIKYGLGTGIRGGAGVIKIVTNPFKTNKKQDQKEVYKEYEVPLSFSVPKEFYIPKYSSYNSNFFREYGIIDWFPNLQINAGNIVIKIKDTKTSTIKLCIEGILSDGTFLSEIKEIKIKED